MKFGMGQSVSRVEDLRLLTGAGCYTDDVDAPGAAHAVVVRSPVANARIASLDAEAARRAPGVLAVLTGTEVEADGLGDLPNMAPIRNRDGSRMAATPYPILAKTRVRHVGQPVALVVAETAAQARDASELLAVDYDELPAVTDVIAALTDGAPQVWEHIPGNLAFDWELGDQAATDAAFANAAHVTQLTVINNRVVPNAMEPRPALALYDPADDRSTLYCATQGPTFVQPILAEKVLKLDRNKLRVITPDVGGGFGMKLFAYPEYALAVWASRRLQRAVRWNPDRGDAFLSDAHGRDTVVNAEAAIDAGGVIQAIRIVNHANLGAMLSNFGAYIQTGSGANMMVGCYRIAAAHVRVKGVVTNTVPVDAYRGAGRPEATYVIERLVDAAAIELGLSQDEMRRRNFIRSEEMPFRTALGNLYDTGDFAGAMDAAMARADWAGFESRRAEAARRGRLRGIGLATYIERCAGGSGMPARLEFNDDDTVTILSGTQTSGQGHETAFRQILSEKLGVDAERIRVVQGDTDRTPVGLTGGSASIPLGGVAVAGAADIVLTRGRRFAAHMLEAAEADIEYSEGTFTVVGTDRRVDLFALARAARAGEIPADDDGGEGLDVTYGWDAEEATYPNGCHICELEIDSESGAVAIAAYTIVDDFGVALNPKLLTGQVQGGLAQGIGQALLENTAYDSSSGQLVTGSFMDYTMPRADTVPALDFTLRNVPCATNPLGLKGAGEAGAIGAPPAVVAAVVDALRPRTGIVHVDMPVTPEKVWTLLQRPRAAAE